MVKEKYLITNIWGAINEISYASPYCYQFRHNTRYRWLARPYPARTFTL